MYCTSTKVLLAMVCWLCNWWLGFTSAMPASSLSNIIQKNLSSIHHSTSSTVFGRFWSSFGVFYSFLYILFLFSVTSVLLCSLLLFNYAVLCSILFCVMDFIAVLLFCVDYLTLYPANFNLEPEKQSCRNQLICRFSLKTSLICR